MLSEFFFIYFFSSFNVIELPFVPFDVIAFFKNFIILNSSSFIALSSYPISVIRESSLPFSSVTCSIFNTFFKDKSSIVAINIFPIDCWTNESLDLSIINLASAGVASALGNSLKYSILWVGTIFTMLLVNNMFRIIT